MGKPDEFKITFTNNKRVYYAGDMVTGNVVTKSRKKLKFRSIRMEFVGETKVARANSKDWITVHSYFDEKVEIYGKGRSMKAGYFEGKSSNILYWAIFRHALSAKYYFGLLLTFPHSSLFDTMT